MSFVGKAISGLAKAVGLMPKNPAPSVASLPPIIAAPPSTTNPQTQPDLDAQQQQMAASVSRGRTSTMLTGGSGEDETKLNTSKMLLGQ